MLNTEKEFDFRRKTIVAPEKKSSLWKKLISLSCVGLFIYNGLSFYQMHNYRVDRALSASVVQNQYENIIKKLNTYDIVKIEHIDTNHELIKDLTKLASNNLTTADWYLADLILQLEQDKRIKSSVKDDLLVEYGKIADNGIKNQKKLGSCFLDLPCILQKGEDANENKHVADEIVKMREVTKLLRQVENFPSPQKVLPPVQ